MLCFSCACVGAFEETDTASPDGDVRNPMGPASTPPDRWPRPPVVGHEFDCATPDVQDPGPHLVRRLTSREYANTVRAVLAVDVSDLVSQLPSEPAESFSAALVVSYEHVTAYANLAKTIVDRLTDLSAFTGCNALTFLCEEQFIEAAGAALFRRPMPPDEREALYELFRAAADAGVSFDDGTRLVLESMLQSPRFLYRIESQAGVSPTRDLDGYELASKLSYSLWDEPPDEELMQAAENGELETAAGVARQVDRMLADPRAIEISFRFLEEWMGLDRTIDLPRGAAMREETEALFKHIVWDENQSLTALFNAPYTFASQELAEGYGLNGARAGVSRYALGDDQPRRDDSGGPVRLGSTDRRGGRMHPERIARTG